MIIITLIIKGCQEGSYIITLMNRGKLGGRSALLDGHDELFGNEIQSTAVCGSYANPDLFAG